MNSKRNKSFSVKGFVGLNNLIPSSTNGIVGERGEEKFLLSKADNVFIGNINELRVRPKEVQLFSLDDGYTTFDELYFYGIVNENLYTIEDDLSLVLLKSNIGSGPYIWCEVGGRVFLQSLDSTYVLTKNVVWNWGVPNAPQPSAVFKEGNLDCGEYFYCCTFKDIVSNVEGAPEYISKIYIPEGYGGIDFMNVPQWEGYDTILYISKASNKELYIINRNTSIQFSLIDTPLYGNLLRTLSYSSPPLGHCIGYYSGCIYIAIPNPEFNSTRIFYSEPQQYHHFDIRELGGRFIDVDGQVRLLAETNVGLLIGTEDNILLHTLDVELPSMFADYGVPNTVQYDKYRGRTYFTSVRGLCSVGIGDSIFINHTEHNFRGDYGSKAATKIIEFEGNTLLMSAVISGGTTYNPLITDKSQIERKVYL